MKNIVLCMLLIFGLFTSAFASNQTRQKAYAFAKKGYELAVQNKHREAATFYTKAIALDGEVSNYYYNRGLSYNYLSKFQLAIRDFNKSIALDGDVSSYAERANAFAKLAMYDDAVASYAQAVDRIAAAEKTERDLIFKNYIFTLVTSEKYGSAVQLGLEYVEQFDGKAIPVARYRSSFFSQLAKAYKKNEDFSTALKWYGEAIRLKLTGSGPEYDAEKSDLYCERASMYAALKDNTNAVLDLNQANELKPGSARGSYSRGSNGTEHTQLVVACPYSSE